MKITWILEEQAFLETHAAMRAAVLQSGHNVVEWTDDWLNNEPAPKLNDGPVVFHGSLGNAATIREKFPWEPGAFCDVQKFNASHILPLLGEHSVHQGWFLLTVRELTADPDQALTHLDSPTEFFVRPDSPLKPFSGRVLKADAVTLRALDFGFYYEDDSLPVIIAPVRRIGREWRFVVVDGNVIAGCEYEASNRSGIDQSENSSARIFAQSIAASIPSPEAAYVLDVCEADGELRVMELNPFSGADLYTCNRPTIVDAVNQVLLHTSA